MELQQQQQQRGHTIQQVKTPSLRPYLQLCALLLIALVALAVTWFLVRDGNDNSTVAIPPVGKPAIVTEAQLHAVARQAKFPVYWAGPKSGAAYELTRAGDGRVWVRYLQTPNQLGTRAAKYLTVGTYPSAHAFVSIQRAARRQGGVSLKIANGGLLVFNAKTPTSVYFGYPKAHYQVEVFDPSSQQARGLVLAGNVTPVD
jgi:hypothetical protein